MEVPVEDSQISITFGKEEFANLQEKAGLSKGQVRCFASWLANLLGVRGDERVASVLGLSVDAVRAGRGETLGPGSPKQTGSVCGR